MLSIEERPDPKPQPGHVLIEVKAFGVNHAETHMREGKWPEATEISGIECAGLVKADPDGRLAAGQKVVAFMGGMGRSINGSYAALTSVPAGNVLPVKTELAWDALAAIPESYATAWAALYGNLDLKAGQTIVIRGATSALGQAAVNIAAHADARHLAKRSKQPSSALYCGLTMHSVTRITVLAEISNPPRGAQEAVARTARRLRSRPPPGRALRAGGGSAGAGPQLVHRGYRYARIETGRGVARRAARLTINFETASKAFYVESRLFRPSARDPRVTRAHFPHGVAAVLAGPSRSSRAISDGRVQWRSEPHREDPGRTGQWAAKYITDQ